MTKTQLKKIIGQRCRKARTASGLTQADVAKHLRGRSGKLGTDREFVSQIEAGESMPSSENLRIMAELFGTTTDWLVGLESPPKRAKRTLLRPLTALVMGAAIAGAPGAGEARVTSPDIHYANRRRRPAKGTVNGPDNLYQCKPLTSLRPVSAPTLP